MVVIFNANELKITKEQMKTLYRKNLILCDDFTLKVATVPDWALAEVEEIIKKPVIGIRSEYPEITNKKAIAFHNHYKYPRLYESICDFDGCQYESGYKRRVPIKENSVIHLNKESVLVLEVIKNIGFYYKKLNNEIQFCDTLFETQNFIPVYK